MTQVLTPPVEPAAFWNYYQEQTQTTAIYPGQGSITGLVYVSLGLAGEAGELCDQVKKVMRDDGNTFTEDRRVKLYGELGDVLWYWARAARELDAQVGDYVALDLCPPEIIRAAPGLGTPTATSRDALVLHRFVAQFAAHTTNVLEGTPLGWTAAEDARRQLANIYHAARSIASSLGVDLRDLALSNLQKLASRKERDALHGSGSAR